MTEPLVGVAEIAELLGVSRQRVNAIVQTHEEFPEPVASLAAGRIWTLASIEEWMRNHRPGARTPTRGPARS